MISSISRADDSIWRTADLEDGEPHEDEASWFRDWRNMYDNYGHFDNNEELISLVPGWDEARRRGWKSLSGAGGRPMAYRGTGDRFEFIAPKHLDPDRDHWRNLPHHWIRYSQGEGGINDPYVMHSHTFRDATDDRNLHSWNLYKNEYDPETEEFHQVENDQWPLDRMSPRANAQAFEPTATGPGYFETVRGMAEKKDRGEAY